MAGFRGENPFRIIAAFCGARSEPRESAPMREAAELAQTAIRIVRRELKRTEGI
jgi:hypothetical protein